MSANIDPMVREFIVAFVRGETDRMWKRIEELVGAGEQSETAELSMPEWVRKERNAMLDMCDELRKQLDQVRVERDNLHKLFDQARVERDNLRKQLDQARAELVAIDTATLKDKERNDLLAERDKLRNQLAYARRAVFDVTDESNRLLSRIADALHFLKGSLGS